MEKDTPITLAFGLSIENLFLFGVDLALDKNRFGISSLTLSRYMVHGDLGGQLVPFLGVAIGAAPRKEITAVIFGASLCAELVSAAKISQANVLRVLKHKLALPGPPAKLYPRTPLPLLQSRCTWRALQCRSQCRRNVSVDGRHIPEVEGRRIRVPRIRHGEETRIGPRTVNEVSKQKLKSF